MSWFGWMLLSATAMAGWLVAQTLLGWWGLVAGFLVGGLFCLGMAWAEDWRAAADPGRLRPRCEECGAAVPDGAAVCRRCGDLVPPPGGAGAVHAGVRVAPAVPPGPGGKTLAGMLFRATAPVAAQLSANHTWRNWAGALLIVAGLSGAIGASVIG